MLQSEPRRDEPPPSEPPSDAPAKKEPEGTFGQFIGCIVMVLAIVGVLVGVGWWIKSLFEPPLVSLKLDEQERSAKLTLAEQTAVQAWAEIEMVHPEVSSNKALAELPHALDYLIEIDGPQGTTKLRCNPFDANVFDRREKYGGVGTPWGQYVIARVRECAITLPAGDYTVRARVEKKIDDPARFSYQKLALELRD